MSIEPPIDLEQLNLISDGDPKDRDFLVGVYLQETANDMTRLKQAIEAGDASTVHRLAHGCAGASLSYGMSAVVPVLQQLEKKAKAGNLQNAAEDLTEAEKELESIKTFLKTYLYSTYPAKDDCAMSCHSELCP